MICKICGKTIETTKGEDEMRIIYISIGIIVGIAIGFLACNWVWDTMLEVEKLLWK